MKYYCVLIVIFFLGCSENETAQMTEINNNKNYKIEILLRDYNYIEEDYLIYFSVLDKNTIEISNFYLNKCFNKNTCIATLNKVKKNTKKIKFKLVEKNGVVNLTKTYTKDIGKLSVVFYYIKSVCKNQFDCFVTLGKSTANPTFEVFSKNSVVNYMKIGFEKFKIYEKDLSYDPIKVVGVK